MKVLVTGVNGQLGHDVVKELVSHDHTAICSDSSPEYRGAVDLREIATEYVQLDITDQEAVWHVVTEIRPDAVIHCAACEKFVSFIDCGYAD